MTKTFYSFNAWKKYHFPKEYRKEMLERVRIRLGFGAWLAKQFLAFAKAKLEAK